jgi:hypothetical protein
VHFRLSLESPRPSKTQGVPPNAVID